MVVRRLGIALILIGAVSAQAQDVSPGVRYKKASPKVNEAFGRQLRNLCGGKVTDKDLPRMFEKVVTSGPNLYGVLKRQLPEAARSGNPLFITVPVNGEPPQKLEGRYYKTPADVLDFAVTVEGLCAPEHARLRWPSRAELDYYWSMIPYDIEEPIFVEESPHWRLLFHGGEDGRIFYVELLPKSVKG